MSFREKNGIAITKCYFKYTDLHYNHLNCTLFFKISDNMDFSVRCIVIALGILTVSVEGFYGGKVLALTHLQID